MLQGHPRQDLCKDLLVALVNHYHAVVLVLDKVASFVVEYFECDAPVATFLCFFFESKTDIYSFGDDMRHTCCFAKFATL